jgi:hypothetical protein
MKMKLSPLVRAIFIPDAPKNLKAVKHFEFTYKLGRFSISRIVKAISYTKALNIIRKQVPTAIVQGAKEVAR